MATASDWRLFARLEQSATRVGMRLTISRHGNHRLALVPLDDSLPIYSRDAELASGDAEHLEGVLQGWGKAVEYYTHLRVLTEAKIKLKEDQVRQERTIQKLTEVPGSK